MLAAVAVASATALALAYPEAVPATAAARAIADCAAVATLGLAIVPAFDTERRRSELASRATVPLIAASAAWLVAELTRQLLAAAQTAGLPVHRLPLRAFLEYTLHTAPGRADLVSVAAAALVCVAASTGRRSRQLSVSIAGLAAIGIAARAISGHLSDSTLGALAVAVHVVAATVWCGGLVALALTITHRGQWARVLPRFSQLSLLCVAALLASGAVGAVLVLEASSQLYATGYGRLLAAKVVPAAALVALGWRNRTVWLRRPAGTAPALSCRGPGQASSCR